LENNFWVFNMHRFHAVGFESPRKTRRKFIFCFSTSSSLARAQDLPHARTNESHPGGLADEPKPIPQGSVLRVFGGGGKHFAVALYHPTSNY
jgi:hypothetical protein